MPEINFNQMYRIRKWQSAVSDMAPIQTELDDDFEEDLPSYDVAGDYEEALEDIEDRVGSNASERFQYLLEEDQSQAFDYLESIARFTSEAHAENNNWKPLT